MLGVGLRTAIVPHCILVTNLRSADAVSGHVQHVVHSAGDPVEPVRVPMASISGEVVTLYYVFALYRCEGSTM